MANERLFGTLPANASDLSAEFLVIKDRTLLPTNYAEPASYEGVKPEPLDRDSTVDDICDFFMEYMQSDVVVRCRTLTLVTLLDSMA